MILNIYIAFAVAQALLGSYTIGRFVARKMDNQEYPIALIVASLILVFAGLFILIIDARFNGTIPSASAELSAISLSILFVILSFSCSSFLYFLAGKFDRKKKIRSWHRVTITCFLTVWLAMSAASISGFTKSAFYASGNAQYAVEDADYDYLTRWRSRTLRIAKNSATACEVAIRETRQLNNSIIFRRREQSNLRIIAGEPAIFDAYLNEKIYPRLRVTRTMRQVRRAPPHVIEKLSFDSKIYGKCTGNTTSIGFRDGIAIKPNDLAEFFRRLHKNIKNNINVPKQNSIPWYSLGATESLSEINIKLLSVTPSNIFASILDFILFWINKLLLVYIFSFFVIRIRRNIYPK